MAQGKQIINIVGIRRFNTAKTDGYITIVGLLNGWLKGHPSHKVTNMHIYIYIYIQHYNDNKIWLTQLLVGLLVL